MTRSAVVRLLLCALAASVAVAATPASTNLDSSQLAQSTSKNVIVILRDQLAGSPPARHAMGMRAAAVAAAHSGLVNELQLARPRSVHSFSTINAFATDVSADEAAGLASRAEVLAVVPDLPIRSKSAVR